MPRGGKAWDGAVLARAVSATGGAYKYRLVTCEGQSRIDFRSIDGTPLGYRPSVTLYAALHPSIIGRLPQPEAQRQARVFLGPALAAGYCPDASTADPDHPYRCPEEVAEPESGPFVVLWNGGPGDCAYLLGARDQHLEVGFRWDGCHADLNGYPTGSGGKPEWLRLEPRVYPPRVMELLTRQAPLP